MTARLLVVKMSSMGDVVHAQPLAFDLRRHLPGVAIDWVCEASFAAIPAMNPAVASVIPVAWRKWRRTLGNPATRAAMADFRDRLRAVRYDWVLDCQGLIKSALVARIARTQRRAGPGWQSAREPIASLGYDLRADVPWNLHVVERNRAIGAAAFGYRLDGPAGFGLQVPSFRPDWLTDEPGATTRSARPLAVLITGASRSQKLWPDAHWIEVARTLRARGYRLVWFWGSPGEHERASRLAAACGSVRQVGDVPVAASERGMTGDAGAAHASGPVAGADSIIPPFLSVGDAAGLLAAGAMVIGLDTGFTHLAGALGRPTIGIFCDFDATQCAVSGDGFCASFGGVGKVPTTTDILDAIEQALSSK